METNRLKRVVQILFFTAVFFNQCQRAADKAPLLLPLEEKARVQYVSYVTNEKNELLYTMDYFDRQYVRADTASDQITHYYIEKNQLKRFYTEERNTIFQEIKIDLAAYAVNGGFPYHNSIPFSYWKPVFKNDRGKGTSWSVHADTQFVCLDASGKPHTLHYRFSGKARFDGWSKIFVPADRTREFKVLHVHWPEFENSLFDLTDNENVWLQKGSASDYFEPEFGLLRSIADYTISKKKEPAVKRKSTWELYLLLIPGK